MANEVRHQCYKCEEDLVFEVKIGRLDTCPNCSAYLHSCRNCRFWSIGAHNQCTENQGEFIRKPFQPKSNLHLNLYQFGQPNRSR